MSVLAKADIPSCTADVGFRGYIVSCTAQALLAQSVHVQPLALIFTHALCYFIIILGRS